MTRYRLVIGAMVLLLVAAACGQKPGVHVATAANSNNSSALSNDTAAGASTDTGAGTGASTDTGAAATGGGTAAGGTASGGASTGGAKAGGATASGPAKVTGHDRTGVTADKITLAVHAPATGAAPLPVASFERARDLYWRWITEAKGEKVLGRSKVEVLFKDDRYQPSTAVQACREMAASAFALVGGGGTDQIQACGRFAESSKVPYFSPGVTENGLRGLNYYYAVSMSYKQQGELLAQYVKKNFPGKKVAAIITKTPNFDDAVAGWEAGVKAAGLNYYETLRNNSGGDTSWYNAFATKLKGAAVDIVYINTAPVDYIRFADQASQQGFKPQFVGVGITMGLNTVLESGCPDLNGGTFFSPFPGLDAAHQLEPDFFAAAQKFGIVADDLGLALWGIAKDENELFKRYGATYGNDLTREDFRAMVAQQTGVHSGLLPDLSYSPADHFGAHQVHVLKADCGSKTYKTVATFASSF